MERLAAEGFLKNRERDQNEQHHEADERRSEMGIRTVSKLAEEETVTRDNFKP
jgi:hypothetical protein